MRVTISLEHRFISTPDGHVWTKTMFPYSFWARYLQVFDEVRVLARVKKISGVNPTWQRADGEGVVFLPVVSYVGLSEFAINAVELAKLVREAINNSDAIIFRVPSLIGTVGYYLVRNNRPFGVEVVGDPYDVFSPGAMKHVARPFLRWRGTSDLHRLCNKACGVMYISKYLRQKYPPHPSSYSAVCSDVELPDEAFVREPRTNPRPTSSAIKLIYVGTMDRLYKGPDILLHSLRQCVYKGLNIKLLMVGDGRYRQKLQAQAVALGLADRVEFVGQLSMGEAVREQLDKADLFVLPSRAEGLGRAIIEAMARALPCVCSNVGGIKELLPEDDLVEPGNAEALARKIMEVLTNPQRMIEMSRRNLVKSMEFKEEALNRSRIDFYREIYNATQHWHIRQA